MIDVHVVLRRLRRRKVYFDTNIFIYILNNTPVFGPVCVELLDACACGQITGVTGDLTLAELLVQPLRNNDAAAVAAVRDLLIEDGAITLARHDRATFERAALHRACHGLKMPDAIQLAAAQLCGAACLISNDHQFPELPDLECLALSAL